MRNQKIEHILAKICKGLLGNIVKFLVETYPNVDLIGQTGSDGWNSLHVAAKYSQKDVQTLQCLIESYKKVYLITNIINKQEKIDGYTPIDCAYYYNHSTVRDDIVTLLRKNGGKANYYDKNGKLVGKGNGELNKLYENIKIKF